MKIAGRTIWYGSYSFYLVQLYYIDRLFIVIELEPRLYTGVVVVVVLQAS